ncbi:MAG: hypothetical protein ACREJY_02940 [Candidatus Rokuibacteriota bacterium]
MRGKIQFALMFLLLATTSCVGPKRYTSLDLALLPCETGDAPVFFRPVEFDEKGEPAVGDQVEQLRQRLRGGVPVTDLVFFVHGWNKNPSSAEADYQNFLCRLHARLRTTIGDQKRQGGLLVVGIFWPSTITNRERDPLFLLPVSYYRIRDRADTVAEVGLAGLLQSLIPAIQPDTRRGPLPVRIQLIGHSFGGRMLVRSMETLHDRGKLDPLLGAAGTVNVVLLNAAVPPSRFEWLTQAVVKAKAQQRQGRFGAARSSDETDSYLFNVHSLNDTANRVLFRIASAFNDDPETCAAGACGVPSYPTLCVDESGRVRRDESARIQTRPELNAWNVDASRVVFDHTDIYKGRIAKLVADLIYDPLTRKLAPGLDSSLPSAGVRCKFLDEKPGVR